MELRDTVKMMESLDYKERFVAEYSQLVIRKKKLASVLEHWDKGELRFTPTQLAREVHTLSKSRL